MPNISDALLHIIGFEGEVGNKLGRNGFSLFSPIITNRHSIHIRRTELEYINNRYIYYTRIYITRIFIYKNMYIQEYVYTIICIYKNMYIQ